jgi:hypothetical protein
MKESILFYGSLFGCPVGKRMSDCPVRVIEYLTFEEKVNWFDGLSPEERKKFINHHNNCLEKR